MKSVDESSDSRELITVHTVTGLPLVAIPVELTLEMIPGRLLTG
jgi:hypothetical protein